MYKYGYQNSSFANTGKYIRPSETITETIQNKEDVEELLENFEEIESNEVEYLSFNSLVRYITYDKNKKKELFRFGGRLFKIDREYIVLIGKNNIRFSVQRYIRDVNNEIIYNTRFFKKKRYNQKNEEEKEKKKKNKKDDINYEEALEKTLFVIDEQSEIIKKQEEELKKLKKIVKMTRV